MAVLGLQDQLSGILVNSGALLTTGFSPDFWTLFWSILWNIVLLLAKTWLLMFVANHSLVKIFPNMKPLTMMDSFWVSLLITILAM